MIEAVPAFHYDYEALGILWPFSVGDEGYQYVTDSCH